MMKNRAYLNDYKLDENNKYVYTGKYYHYQGDVTKQKRNFVFITFCITFAVIMSGCINSSGMNNSFYVIIPYIAEVGCVFTLCWNVIRLAAEGNSVKEYVYTSVTKHIPNAIKTLMFFTLAGLVATMVYLVIHIIQKDLDFSVSYPILKIITFLLSFLQFKQYKSMSFAE